MELTQNRRKTERPEKGDAKHGMVLISTHHLKEFYNYKFILVVVIFEKKKNSGGNYDCMIIYVFLTHGPSYKPSGQENGSQTCKFWLS